MGMTQRLKFQVRGSAPQPYTVTFVKDDGSPFADCTCPHRDRAYCKHRIAILSGDSAAIVSGNANDVAKVLTWFSGTDIARALLAVQHAERALAAASANLVAAKELLSRLSHAREKQRREPEVN
jgi:uncharacterized Zn finger protein